MNIEDLRLPRGASKLSLTARAPRPRSREPYLKGPVSLIWLTVAGRLPGAAMQVAVFLAYLKGLKRRNQFSVPTAKMAEVFGVSRFAVYRALKALECAGLVTVKRHRGRHPIVALNASAGDTSLTNEAGRSAD
jgi:hypothetical protein